MQHAKAKVYLKDFEMPKSCDKCSFGHEECGTVPSKRWTCRLTDVSFPKYSSTGKWFSDGRHETCPLLEEK